MNDVPPLGEDLSAGRSAAEEKVKNPSTWLMISTIVSVVLTVVLFLASILGVFDPANFIEGYEEMDVPTGGRIIEVIQLLVQLGIGGVIYLGAMKMQRLESWGFSLAAAILAVIPCISPCCLFTLPFGVWALIVLLNDEVKQHFR